MTDVKSVQPPRPLLQAGVRGTPAAPLSCKSVPLGNGKADDKKSLSTDAVPAASPPPEELRKALIDELLTSNRSTEINRYYDGSVAAWTDSNVNTFAGGAGSVNAIPQGTGAGQRLGDSIRMRRLRIRFHLRPGQAVEPGDLGTSAPADVDYSLAMRVIVGIDKMPVIGTPVYADTSSWGIGASFPFSQAATHTQPRATFTGVPAVNSGQMHLAVRNPQTLTRYHILYDEIHNNSSKYNQTAPVVTAAATTLLGYWRTSSEWLNLEFDLHGLVAQWYDQANNQAWLVNRVFFMVVSDAPAAATARYKWASELEFENCA